VRDHPAEKILERALELGFPATLENLRLNPNGKRAYAGLVELAAYVGVEQILMWEKPTLPKPREIGVDRAAAPFARVLLADVIEGRLELSKTVEQATAVLSADPFRQAIHKVIRPGHLRARARAQEEADEKWKHAQSRLRYL
jgi:hypothetical protein